MAKDKPIVLRVWEGDYGVASVDPYSLYLMTLLKLRKVLVYHETAYLPQWRGIPSIQYQDKIIANECELSDIANTIRDSPFSINLDDRLDANSRSRLMAYHNYFLENVQKPFLFHCWLNNINYEHAIKPWYSAVIPFPFHYFYLKKKRKMLNQLYKATEQEVTPEFYRLKKENITHCLEDFNNMLSDGRPYIFGNFPTTIDAAIYSFLTVALHIPLPDPELQQIIKSQPLLIRFVKKMGDNYFPDTPTTMKYVKPINTDSNSSDRAPTRTIILAGLFAAAGMLLYAWNTGLIRSSVVIKWKSS